MSLELARCEYRDELDVRDWFAVSPLLLSDVPGEVPFVLSGDEILRAELEKLVFRP